MKKIFSVKSNEESKNRVLLVLAFLLPLLLAFLYTIPDGKTIFDIYLPKGDWNDEVSYYKQIESVVHYNVPRGYWGFNEKTARMGSFGAWGFIGFIPYIIWGKLFSWNLLSPILCNTFLMMLAMLIFAKLVRANEKQLTGIFFFLLIRYLYTRTMLSGMLESLVHSLILIIAGLFIRYAQAVDEDESKQSIGIWYISLILILFLGIFRPYYFSFTLFPFVIAVKDKRWKRCLILGISLMLALLAWALSYALFSAPFYYSLVDITIFAHLKHFRIVEAFILLFSKVGGGIMEVIHGIMAGNGIGYIYSFWLFQLLLLVCFSVLSFREKKGRKGLVYILICIVNLAVFTAICLFYDVFVGGRHIAAIILLGACLIIVLENSRAAVALLAVAAVIGLCMPLSDYDRKIPYKDSETIEKFEKAGEIFEDTLTLQEGVSWGNTISFHLYDETESGEVVLPYNVLFYLPSGFAIQFDTLSIQENKSGYAYVANGGTVEKRIIEQYNAKLLYKNDEGALYFLNH